MRKETIKIRKLGYLSISKDKKIKITSVILISTSRFWPKLREG